MPLPRRLEHARVEHLPCDGGCGVDDVDPCLRRVADEGQGVLAHGVTDDVQLVTRDHPQELAPGGVEAERVGERGTQRPAARPRPLGFEEVRPVAVEHVGQIAVLHGDALGAAGGARCVDDVGEVRGEQRTGAVVVREIRFVRGRHGLVEQERRHRFGYVAHRRDGGQDEGRSGLRADRRDALRGVVDVDRQVRGARLEDRQDRHHGVRGARHGDADEVAGSHAAGDEQPGQPVGVGVEQAEGEAGRAVRDGYRVGRRAGLSLEQARQRPGRPFDGASARPAQDLAPLGVRTRGEPSGLFVGPGGDVLQQTGQAPQYAPRGIGGVDVLAVVEFEAEPAAGVDGQAQRVVGALERLVDGVPQQTDVESGHRGAPDGMLHGDVLEGDGGVEEFGGAYGAVDLGEAEVFVSHHGRVVVLDPGQQVRHRLRRVDPYPGGHGVHHQAHHAVAAGELRRAARDGVPVDDVLASGQLGQQERPSALDQGVDGEFAAPGQGGECRRGLLGKLRDDAPLAPVRGAGAGPVRDERGAVDPRQHALPGLLGLGAVLLPDPAEIVLEGHGRLQPLRRAAVPVDAEEVAEDQRQRPAVQQDVVVGDQQDVPVGREPYQREPEQRRFRHVEAPGALLGEQPGEARSHFLLAEAGEVDLLPRRLDRPRDGLDGLAGAAAQESCPQARVPADQCAAGGAQHLGVERPGQLQRRLDVVEVDVPAVGLSLLVEGVEKNALLQRRERQDRFQGCLSHSAVPHWASSSSSSSTSIRTRLPVRGVTDRLPTSSATWASRAMVLWTKTSLTAMASPA
ncbi:hypothetical protein EES46_22995 [Streptomyces sp. ADI98-10]|nr:hypothetical protein EES46_22995 [Streptomyces sp. ADI98-10]